MRSRTVYVLFFFCSLCVVCLVPCAVYLVRAVWGFHHPLVLCSCLFSCSRSLLVYLCSCPLAWACFSTVMLCPSSCSLLVLGAMCSRLLSCHRGRKDTGRRKRQAARQRLGRRFCCPFSLWPCCACTLTFCLCSASHVLCVPFSRFVGVPRLSSLCVLLVVLFVFLCSWWIACVLSVADACLVGSLWR